MLAQTTIRASCLILIWSMLCIEPVKVAGRDLTTPVASPQDAPLAPCAHRMVGATHFLVVLGLRIIAPSETDKGDSLTIF